MKVVTVIQARRGSTRLPDKIMMLLAGKALLIRMVERVRVAKLSGQIVVATTTDRDDDVIEELCNQENIACFRGHPTDLLDRHYQAALAYDAEAVVKIPSDCPLIDPEIIDKVIGYFLDHKEYDFVSNLHPATYPDGNDVEIMKFTVLKDAWEKAKLPLEREHTTPYIWERPDEYKIANIAWETGEDFSMTHRFTIDYKEDYAFIKRVYDELYEANPDFRLSDILYLLERKPEIFKINSMFAGVNWYRDHLDELKTIKSDQTKKI